MSRATVIKTDGTEQELDRRPSLKEAQQIVGGYIELVRASNGGHTVTLVVDEEGKQRGWPVNKVITDRYGKSIYGGYIVGDVIVLEGWKTVGR